METKHDPTRRGLLKKAAYAAPVILTLQAASALAKSGSEKEPLEKKPKKTKKAKNADWSGNVPGVERNDRGPG